MTFPCNFSWEAAAALEWPQAVAELPGSSATAYPQSTYPPVHRRQHSAGAVVIGILLLVISDKGSSMEDV
eukprot:scaffold7412_cov115-Cylindrotheca_fusiformis.AAC.10